jgi:hypothetical protein
MNMETNALPKYDMTDNPTECCPRFNPEGWDDQELHFQNKLFVRAKTKSVAHIPINMGSVFKKTFKAMEDADAISDENLIVMSREQSAWSADHLFAVTKEVPNQEMVQVTGDFVTKVFEGPYKKMPQWCEELNEGIRAEGKDAKETYFFYTTCPKCAKTYGKNYVVGVAQVQ